MKMPLMIDNLTLTLGRCRHEMKRRRTVPPPPRHRPATPLAATQSNGQLLMPSIAGPHPFLARPI